MIKERKKILSFRLNFIDFKNMFSLMMIIGIQPSIHPFPIQDPPHEGLKGKKNWWKSIFSYPYKNYIFEFLIKFGVKRKKKFIILASFLHFLWIQTNNELPSQYISKNRWKSIFSYPYKNNIFEFLIKFGVKRKKNLSF